MFLIVILCFSQSNAFPQLIFAFDFGIFFCCKLFLKRKRKEILHSNMCNFGKIMKQIFFPYTAHIKPSFLLRFQKVSQATMKTIKVISRVSHLPDNQEPKCSISSKSQPNILLKAGFPIATVPGLTLRTCPSDVRCLILLFLHIPCVS